ncbi:MAG: hypothetical protein H7Y27_12645 [Gemmatimonadaceae bacterium]|nr:hypothetical protein [Chitinophagaceae bacterium]
MFISPLPVNADLRGFKNLGSLDWPEYEDKPTFRIHEDFGKLDYSYLKKFFEAVMKGPGKSE